MAFLLSGEHHKTFYLKPGGFQPAISNLILPVFECFVKRDRDNVGVGGVLLSDKKVAP